MTNHLLLFPTDAFKNLRREFIKGNKKVRKKKGSTLSTRKPTKVAFLVQSVFSFFFLDRFRFFSFLFFLDRFLGRERVLLFSYFYFLSFINSHLRLIKYLRNYYPNNHPQISSTSNYFGTRCINGIMNERVFDCLVCNINRYFPHFYCRQG